MLTARIMACGINNARLSMRTAVLSMLLFSASAYASSGLVFDILTGTWVPSSGQSNACSLDGLAATSGCSSPTVEQSATLSLQSEESALFIVRNAAACDGDVTATLQHSSDANVSTSSVGTALGTVIVSATANTTALAVQFLPLRVGITVVQVVPSSLCALPSGVYHISIQARISGPVLSSVSTWSQVVRPPLMAPSDAVLGLSLEGRLTPVTFTLTAQDGVSEEPGRTYTWTMPSGSTFLTYVPVLTLSSLPVAEAGSVLVTVRNAAGSHAVQAATIIVLTPPAFDAAWPATISVNRGRTVRLVARVAAPQHQDGSTLDGPAAPGSIHDGQEPAEAGIAGKDVHWLVAGQAVSTSFVRSSGPESVLELPADVTAWPDSSAGLPTPSSMTVQASVTNLLGTSTLATSLLLQPMQWQARNLTTSVSVNVSLDGSAVSGGEHNLLLPVLLSLETGTVTQGVTWLARVVHLGPKTAHANSRQLQACSWPTWSGVSPLISVIPGTVSHIPVTAPVPSLPSGSAGTRQACEGEAEVLITAAPADWVSPSSYTAIVGLSLHPAPVSAVTGPAPVLPWASPSPSPDARITPAPSPTASPSVKPSLDKAGLENPWTSVNRVITDEEVERDAIMTGVGFGCFIAALSVACHLFFSTGLLHPSKTSVDYSDAQRRRAGKRGVKLLQRVFGCCKRVVACGRDGPRSPRLPPNAQTMPLPSGKMEEMKEGAMFANPMLAVGKPSLPANARKSVRMSMRHLDGARQPVQRSSVRRVMGALAGTSKKKGAIGRSAATTTTQVRSKAWMAFASLPGFTWSSWGRYFTSLAVCVSLWDVVRWAQWVVLLNQLPLPVHPALARFSSRLAWTSGILPIPAVNNAIVGALPCCDQPVETSPWIALLRALTVPGRQQALVSTVSTLGAVSGLSPEAIIGLEITAAPTGLFRFAQHIGLFNPAPDSLHVIAMAWAGAWVCLSITALTLLAWAGISATRSRVVSTLKTAAAAKAWNANQDESTAIKEVDKQIQASKQGKGSQSLLDKIMQVDGVWHNVKSWATRLAALLLPTLLITSANAWARTYSTRGDLGTAFLLFTVLVAWAAAFYTVVRNAAQHNSSPLHAELRPGLWPFSMGHPVAVLGMCVVAGLGQHMGPTVCLGALAAVVTFGTVLLLLSSAAAAGAAPTAKAKKTVPDGTSLIRALSLRVPLLITLFIVQMLVLGALGSGNGVFVASSTDTGGAPAVEARHRSAAFFSIVMHSCVLTCLSCLSLHSWRVRRLLSMAHTRKAKDAAWKARIEQLKARKEAAAAERAAAHVGAARAPVTSLPYGAPSTHGQDGQDAALAAVGVPMDGPAGMTVPGVSAAAGAKAVSVLCKGFPDLTAPRTALAVLSLDETVAGWSKLNAKPVGCIDLNDFNKHLVYDGSMVNPLSLIAGQPHPVSVTSSSTRPWSREDTAPSSLLQKARRWCQPSTWGKATVGWLSSWAVMTELVHLRVRPDMLPVRLTRPLAAAKAASVRKIDPPPPVPEPVPAPPQPEPAVEEVVEEDAPSPVPEEEEEAAPVPEPTPELEPLPEPEPEPESVLEEEIVEEEFVEEEEEEEESEYEEEEEVEDDESEYEEEEEEEEEEEQAVAQQLSAVRAIAQKFAGGVAPKIQKPELNWQRPDYKWTPGQGSVEIDYSSQWTEVARLLTTAETFAEQKKKQAEEDAERKARNAALAFTYKRLSVSGGGAGNGRSGGSPAGTAL